jgi:hypothetical protein
MIRAFGFLLAAAVSANAFAATGTQTPPTKLPPAWQAKAREIYKTAVETPTVAGRGQVPKLATYLAAKLKAAGWPASDLRVIPYVSGQSDKTAALIARWRGRGASKPILILAHLDVVPALKSDWTTDPFKLVEKDGYFYGRGTSDDKQGAVGAMVALMKLRAEGFKPDRDIVLLFTGDEETTARAPNSVLSSGANGSARRVSPSMQTKAIATSLLTAALSAVVFRPRRRHTRATPSRFITPAATAPSQGRTMQSTLSQML